MSLPKSVVAQVIGKQLLRSGTSVGAQYAEAYRARSKADFINKIEAVTQELEETDFWLELLIESDTVSRQSLGDLKDEQNQLMAIFVTMITRTKAGMK